MASRASFNARSPTIKRILREAAELSSSPSPDYVATPQEDNLFEWHFTLRGPPGNSSSPNTIEPGPYAEGIYHGRIVLPPTYPLRPPSFRFLTPSGRFETNREICLSISGHHEETWQPAWGLRTALVALRTFMETDAKGQVGGLECGVAQRSKMAKESRLWKCSSCGKSNEEILRESEEVAKLAEPSVEPEVPAELTMAFKDDILKQQQQARAKDKTGDEESAELAEGFVQTVPSPEFQAQSMHTVVDPLSRPTMVQQEAPIQPAMPAALPVRIAAAPMAIHLRPVNGGVPVWLDKLIWSVAACLFAMLMRVILRS